MLCHDVLLGKLIIFRAGASVLCAPCSVCTAGTTCGFALSLFFWQLAGWVLLYAACTTSVVACNSRSPLVWQSPWAHVRPCTYIASC